MTYSRRELTGQQGKIHCIDHGEMGMGLDLVEFVIAHVSAASSSPALRCQQTVDFGRDEDVKFHAAICEGPSPGLPSLNRAI